MPVLAAPPTVGNPGLNLTIFAGFVLVTFAVMVATARGGRATTDYYTGGQGFTGAQNGTAIAGDYLSAAAFLGVVGAVAVYGYDGVMFAIGSLTGWVVALLFVAEPLRNTGRYTMADVLSYRLRVRPVRSAAATSTLLVSLLYLVAQIAGAGGLISLLVGIGNSDRFGQSVVIGGVEGHHVGADPQGGHAGGRGRVAGRLGAGPLGVRPVLAARRDHAGEPGCR